jgi:hypothetical protein
LADKAKGSDYLGRFREIVSDPLNLLIRRNPLAGYVENGYVYLHNGLRVPLSGAGSYYDKFSEILVINRGVHEPLEEYAFQQLLPHLSANPTMLELGAYWAHYSMWLLQQRPLGSVWLVEPDADNLQAGIDNFHRNGFRGEFVKASVAHGEFTVDQFLADHAPTQLDILHSDIQGHEVQMLIDAAKALSAQRVRYVFVSTHSQDLHAQALDLLRGYGYCVEINADYLKQTTSFDGLLFARSRYAAPIFPGFSLLGRTDILSAGPDDVIKYLSQVNPI